MLQNCNMSKPFDWDMFPDSKLKNCMVNALELICYLLHAAESFLRS